MTRAVLRFLAPVHDREVPSLRLHLTRAVPITAGAMLALMALSSAALIAAGRVHPLKEVLLCAAPSVVIVLARL